MKNCVACDVELLSGIEEGAVGLGDNAHCGWRNCKKDSIIFYIIKIAFINSFRYLCTWDLQTSESGRYFQSNLYIASTFIQVCLQLTLYSDIFGFSLY